MRYTSKGAVLLETIRLVLLLDLSSLVEVILLAPVIDTLSPLLGLSPPPA